MAISFGKKSPASAPAQQQQKPASSSPAQQPKQQQAPANKPKAGGLSFMKTGAAAKTEMAKVEHKAEMAAKNKTQRFWLPKDKSAAITFLDGDLKDGMLNIPFYYEHQINMNGSWKNWFICTQDEEPCPICEGGHQPSYVGILTIIDHSEYTSQKDGKVYKDQVRILTAKKDSIKQLQKLAEKRGGLRGCKFDVSRTGDKSPGIGNMFDFTEKLNDAQLFQLYKERSQPFKYEELLLGLYMPAKELRKMGFGSMAVPIGGEDMPSEGDMAEQL